MSQPTATAMMRIKHVKFTHVLPADVLALMPNKKERICTIKVGFSDNGEPYGTSVRHAGNTLDLREASTPSSSFLEVVLHADVRAHLTSACAEALAIVQPLVVLH